MYISKPKKAKPEAGVLFLTDVFGIQLPEGRLLADSFARAGYLVVAPDMFNGTPAPADINAPTPGFDLPTFIAAHGPNATDPIVSTAIDYMRNTLGLTKIGATGYCFGGRYALRFANDKGIDAAFTAHPSLLEDNEISAIGKPASIAFAGELYSLRNEVRDGLTSEQKLTTC